MSAPINKAAVEEKTVPLQIKKLVDNARLPTRGSAAAAGWDLHSAEATVIPAGGRKLVSTGLAMAIPGGCCEFSPAVDCDAVTDDKPDGRVAPRSGLAVKNFIDTGAGVIDADVSPYTYFIYPFIANS
jgi:dUTP pyrophosphatase